MKSTISYQLKISSKEEEENIKKEIQPIEDDDQDKENKKIDKVP